MQWSAHPTITLHLCLLLMHHTLAQKFFENFGKARICALVSWAFNLWKACSFFSVQQNGVSFFTNSLSGEAKLEKLGINIL